MLTVPCCKYSDHPLLVFWHLKLKIVKPSLGNRTWRTSFVESVHYAVGGIMVYMQNSRYEIIKCACQNVVAMGIILSSLNLMIHACMYMNYQIIIVSRLISQKVIKFQVDCSECF